MVKLIIILSNLVYSFNQSVKEKRRCTLNLLQNALTMLLCNLYHKFLSSLCVFFIVHTKLRKRVTYHMKMNTGIFDNSQSLDVDFSRTDKKNTELGIGIFQHVRVQ